MKGPALADVLACLSTMDSLPWWRTTLTSERVRLGATCIERRVALRVASPKEWLPLCGWRHASTVEAWEALQAHGLAPPDDERRRWLCPGGSRESRDPFRLRALAAVAALGVARWRSAEELARVVDPGAAVVWWAAPREALVRSLLDVALTGGFGEDAARFIAAVALRHPGEDVDALRWYEERATEDLHEARASAALAAMGVWVVSHEPGLRVRLAVEPP